MEVSVSLASLSHTCTASLYHIGSKLVLCCAVQAGAGLVADSVPESEYEETLNKAAALGRAIDLAEQAFVQPRCE